MNALLVSLVLLAARGDEDVGITVYLVKATLEDKASTDASLKEIESDLKNLSTFNRFELAGSGMLRLTIRANHVQTQVALRDGGRYGLGLTLQGSLDNVGLDVSEDFGTEEVSLTSGGATQRSVRKSTRTLLRTTMNMPTGRLFIAGTTAVEGKSGPVTMIVVLKATPQ